MTRERGATAAAAAISGLTLAAGLALDSGSTLAAYLVGWVAVSAIPIGALGILMTSYLVRRQWTQALYPVLTATLQTLPVVGLCFLPVLVGIKELYPASADPQSLPPFKAVYLAPWFFAGRTVVYFAIWFATASWLRRAWKNSEAMNRSASVGLIGYALTVSLAGIDWVESLQPEFHSSIFGLLYLGMALLNGLAFAIACSLLLGRRLGQRSGYSAVLLSTILLWGYLHAMQYIVIWSGDIPDEAIWYIDRSEHGWQFALLALALGQFVFPFFALLNHRVRADRRWLFGLCALTLAMRVVEAGLLILPALKHAAPLMTGLMLPPALILVSGIFWLTLRAALRNDVAINPAAWPAHDEAGMQSTQQARRS
jgi:hypothetical protein